MDPPHAAEANTSQVAVINTASLTTP